MPTVLSRTFALLNNTKAQHDTNIPKLLQESHAGTQHISIELEDVEKPEMSIWKAAELGDKTALQYYIDRSQIDLHTLLNMRDPDTDCTLLHLVISHAPTFEKIIQMLLENGADPNAHNIYNVQPIHMVALHRPDRALPTLQLLLDHKVDPNVVDGDGWTPLHYCARFCQPPAPALELLLSYGADINRRDAAHKTPLFALLANGDYPEALELVLPEADLTLLGDFLDPLTRRTQSGSLILQAVKYGRLRSMAILIRHKQLRQVVTRDELQHAREFALDPEMALFLRELEEAVETDGVSEKKTRHRLFMKVNQMIKRSIAK